MTTELENRQDYQSEHGLARWWGKDGAWHIALPSRAPQTGLKTNVFRYTEDSYSTRDAAIAAILS